jgi:hypothetical protein
VPTRVLLEGPAIEPLLAQVREEYGSGIRIISADKVRNGGFGGFFAKQHYELAVEVPDEAERSDQPAAVKSTVSEAVNSLEQLLEQAESRDRIAAAPVSPARTKADRKGARNAGREDIDEWFRPEPGTEFAEMLADLDSTKKDEDRRPAPRRRGEEKEANVRPFHPARAIGSPVNGAKSEQEPDPVPSLAEVMGGLGVSAADPAPIDPPAQSAAAAYGLNPDVDLHTSPKRPTTVKAPTAPKTPVTVKAPVPPRPPAPGQTPVAAIAPSAPEPETPPTPERISAELALPAPADIARDTVVRNLVTMGMPTAMADKVNNGDTYAGVLLAIAERPIAPNIPDRPGDVLLVAGDLGTAVPVGRRLLAELGLDENNLLLAAPSAAGTGVHSSRVLHNADVARTRAPRLHKSSTAAVVVLEAPPNATDPAWVGQMRDALDATALWAVVDATRKATDTARQLGALGEVEALIVEGVELTADPATVLGLEQPIYSLDGKPATPHYWASMLCGRITKDVIPAPISAPTRRPTRDG